jgi:hypothetical protein
MRIDPAAPLNCWYKVKSFQTREECEAERQKVINTRVPDPISQSAFLAARCVDALDPQLLAK